MVSTADMRVNRSVQVNFSSSGEQQTKAALQGVQAAYEAVGKAAEVAATTTETSARRQGTIIGSFERLRRTLDPTIAVQERLANSTATLDRAFSAGRVGPEEYARLIGAVRERVERDLQRIAEAQDKARRSTATPGGETSMPMPWGRASASPTSASGVPLIRRETDELGRNEAAAKKAQAANDNLTKGLGLQRHEWINLGRQMQDVGTMALMGASPFQILASQGAQVYDVLSSSQGGVRGALKEVGSTLTGLVTPGRVVFGGLAAGAVTAAAALYSYSQQQKEIEQRLNGIGRASGMTVGGVNRVAEARSGAAGISVGDARDALSTFGATGRIGEQIGAGLLPIGARLSRMLGVDLTEANTMLAKAFADPAKGAETLNERLGNLNDSTRRTIELQVLSGDRLGAQKTLMDSVSASIAGSTEKLSLWTEAWIKAKGVLDGVGAATKSVIDPSLEEQIAAAQKRLDDLTIRRNDPNRPGNRGGFGIPLDIPQGEDPAVPELREQLKQLQEDRIERDRAAAFGMAGAAQAQRSRDAGDLLRPYEQEQRAVEELRARLAGLNELRSEANRPSDISADRVAKAYDEAKGAVDTFLTSEEKRRKSDELSLRSIMARTDAERAAIAVEQKRLDLSGQLVRTEERLRQEQEARRQEFERSTRAAEDRLRASNDNLGLAGRLPYDRAREEIDRRYRRLNEEETSPGARARNAAARSADLRALDIEQIQGPLRAATLSINEQIGALKVMKDSLYATDEQAATYAARQELLNAAIRAGVDPAKAYGGQLETLAKQMGQVAATNAEYQRVKSNIVGGMDEIRSGFSGMLSGITSDLVSNKGKNIGQILVNSMTRLNDQMLERLVFKPLTEGIFGRFGQAGGGWLGNLLGPMFGNLPNAPSPLTLPNITAPTATITAATVYVNGGIGGGALGTNPITGSPLGGVGSGRDGFGLGGPQSAGVAQPLGSGLGSFGFGALGTRVAGPGFGSFDQVAPRLMQDLMRDHGLTREQAAGIVGNFGHETGGFRFAQELNPVGGGRGGLGWAQWTGPRRIAFERYSAERGLDPRSYEANYGFLTQGEPGEWGRGLSAVREQSTMQGAARAFETTYERAGVKAYDSRFSYGNRALGLGPRADLGTTDFDAASKSFAQSTETASKGVADLSQSVSSLPDAASSATNSLSSFASSLFNFKPEPGGGGISLAGLFGGGGGSGGGFGIAAGEVWSANGNIMTSRGPLPLSMYEKGGIATSPQVSIFGEGRTPEAYVPLPDGRSIPVTMRNTPSAPAANGNAAPSYTDARTVHYNIPPLANGVTPDDVVKAIANYDKQVKRQLPGMMAEAQRRFG